MKTTQILLTLILLMVQSSRAVDGEIDIHLTKTSLDSVIKWYATNSGLSLIVSSEAQAIVKNSDIDFDTGDSPLLRTDAFKKLETAIMKQTGVVITRLDAATASVTFNDALVETLKKRDKGHLRKVLPPNKQMQ